MNHTLSDLTNRVHLIERSLGAICPLSCLQEQNDDMLTKLDKVYGILEHLQNYIIKDTSSVATSIDESFLSGSVSNNYLDKPLNEIQNSLVNNHEMHSRSGLVCDQPPSVTGAGDNSTGDPSVSDISISPHPSANDLDHSQQVVSKSDENGDYPCVTAAGYRSNSAQCSSNASSSDYHPSGIDQTPIILSTHAPALQTETPTQPIDVSHSPLEIFFSDVISDKGSTLGSTTPNDSVVNDADLESS